MSDPTVSNPSMSDPSMSDPSMSDPSMSDPSMSDPSTSTELALQICFGIFGILSTIATLASLHHQESLGCVLIRRLFQPRPTHHDLETSTEAYEDANEHVPLERQTTMPPAYDQSESDASSIDHSRPCKPYAQSISGPASRANEVDLERVS